MTDRTARIIGGERGTGLVIARALAGAGFTLADAADGGEAADRVVLVLNGSAATLEALVAARLQPFHDLVEREAPAIRARGGAILVVVLVPPGAGLWQEMAADWIAAGIARCAAAWGAAGPRINGLVARIDGNPALPRFLAPRAAAAGELRPADIAATALALCAESSSAITGQVLRMAAPAG